MHMKMEENVTLEALEDADDIDLGGHEPPQTLDAILDLSDNPHGVWKDTLHQEYDNYHDYNFFDEITGKPLDPEKVKKGEQLEMEKFKSRQVYDCVPRDDIGNGKVIKTRWVRVKKGEDVRCRLVAQEFAAGDPRDDLFASTPPLFSARWIVSSAATRRRRPWTLMSLDVSCAFLYALVVRDLFIEIPQADPRSRDGNLVGRLRKALYGTRDAPQLWQRTLGKVLKELGFCSSKLQPGVFRHKARDIIMVTHVDDFLVAGPPEELEWVRDKLREHFEVNGQMIGERDNNNNCSIVKQVKFLGRTIRREEDGFTWEADTKHVRILLEESGMEDCKSLSLPLAREDEQLNDDNKGPQQEEKEMDVNHAKKFRRAAARLNYLALDRPDIAVAVNRLARCMAKPLVQDELALKRVLRYLKGRPRCQITFRTQDPVTKLVALSDSDWAGCRRTRKSTSGFAIFHGHHLLAFASKMQKATALSSAEAELVAQSGAISEALAVRNMLQEFQISLGLTSKCDSSAARGIMSRQGAGRVKHLEVRHLWMQELVESGAVVIQWIPRKMNPSDSLTHVSSDFHSHMADLQLQFCKTLQTDIALSAVSEGGVLEID